MRMIPKKTNDRDAVWRCYTMKDVIIALATFALAFLLFWIESYVAAVIVCVLIVCMFVPTGEGLGYEVALSAIKFLFSKKSYERGRAGADTRDLFPFKGVDGDGTVRYGGGRYARVVEIGEKNFALETKAEQDRDIEAFARALKEIPVGMEADLVTVRRPIKLDRQCAMLFSRLKGEGPGPRRELLRDEADRCDRVNRVKKKYAPYFCLVIYGRDKQSLDAVAAAAAARIASALPARILEREDAEAFLRLAVSRKSGDEEAAKGGSKIGPKRVRFRSSGFIEDGKDGIVAAVSDYPLKVRNAWGARLLSPAGGKAVLRMVPLERDKAIRRIDRSVTEMSAKRYTVDKASEQASAETHLDTMKDLLEALQDDNETLFDATLLFESYGKDAKKSLKSFVRSQDFKLSLLYGRQIQGYKAAAVSPEFPLKGFSRGINSSTLAAAFPFVRVYTSDETGTLVGRASGAPFVLDIWKRGGEYQNSNAMVIGKSGSGKSFFLKSLIAAEWAKGARVFILDPENEYQKLASSVGGETLDVATPAEGRINPFHIYETLTEDGEIAPFETVFNAHLKTLESFFKIVMEGASAEVLELVNSLAAETYRRMGVDETRSLESLSANDFPTFSDVLKTLALRRESASDEQETRELRSASIYLEKFVTGRYSDIWNGPSTMTADCDVMDFTFQSLFSNKNTTVANAQMLLLFGFLEQEIINSRNSVGGRRTIVAVDEAHLFIDAKYPIALDFFYSMCKRIRKYDGAFIAATQSVGDWNANEELRFKTSAILKNSQYTFVFKLSPPDMKDLDDLFSAGGGFNDEEKRRIVTARTGQMFFVGSATDRFLVNVETGDCTRSLFEEKKSPAQGAGEGGGT